MIIEIDQDVQTFLEHHGVKGQKWGVRQARKEVVGQTKTARHIIKDAKKAKTKSERDAAIQRYQTDVINKMKTKEFRETYKTANTVTKGDIAAHILAFGPLAPLTIHSVKQMSEQNRQTGIDQQLVIARNIIKDLKSIDQ